MLDLVKPYVKIFKSYNARSKRHRSGTLPFNFSPISSNLLERQ